MSFVGRLSLPPCSPRLFTEYCWLSHWILKFAHTPSSDYQKPLPSSPDSNPGKGPRGTSQLWVWRKTTSNFYGIEHWATRWEPCWLTRSSFFPPLFTPKAMSDNRERNTVAWANYQGFHVGNVLSDPPALRNVMEAEAKCSGPSPPTCSHQT